MDERNRQLFCIEKDILMSASPKEIFRTALDMGEMGIFYPPVQYFDISIDAPEKVVADWVMEKDMQVVDFKKGERYIPYIFRYDFNEDLAKYKWKIALWNYKKQKIDFVNTKDPIFAEAILESSIEKNVDYDEFYECQIEQMGFTQASFLRTLIVLLNTKNINKQTREIKRYAAPSKKNPKNYKYLTTIKMGEISETYTNEKSGIGHSSPRPHLRRGHIRTQHFGVGNKEVKKIFIQPVFVNADEGWIENQRKAYVVKAAT